MISNIIATTHSLIPSSITAFPGFYVENVVIRDMIIQCKGGGTETDAERVVPEMERAYPENRMFGHSLPAYGLYFRHARNITLDNILFNRLEPDSRVTVYLEDAHQIKIRDLRTDEKEPTISEINTSGISIK